MCVVQVLMLVNIIDGSGIKLSELYRTSHVVWYRIWCRRKIMTENFNNNALHGKLWTWKSGFQYEPNSFNSFYPFFILHH